MCCKILFGKLGSKDKGRVYDMDIMMCFIFFVNIMYNWELLLVKCYILWVIVVIYL